MSPGPDPLPLAAPDDGLAQFTLDRAGNVAGWSRDAERLLGCKADEIIGRHFSALHPPSKQAAGEPDEVLRRALADGSCAEERQYQQRDGALFQAAATVTAFFDAGRRHLGFGVVLRDVSAARRREQASEARYRTLFEHAQVGVVLADAQSYYIDANPSACRMLGYSRDELIGLHAADIVVPAEVGQIDPALNEINGQSTHRREWQFRRKDGSVFAAAVVATQMPDGALLGTIRDVSDSKQAHDYRARLAAIVESSADAIIGNDLDGAVTSWNAGAEAIFGWPAGEMIGTPSTRLIPADRLPEETPLLAQVLRGERVEQLQTRRQTRDGRLLDVSITASPIRDAGGRIVGAAMIARDVSVLQEREREIGRLSRLYAALSHVNQAIAWTPTRGELFQKVCWALAKQGGFHLAWIGWHDPATNRLTPVARCGADSDLLDAVAVYVDERPEGLGPSGSAFRTGRPYVSNDLAGDPAVSPWRAEVARRGFQSAATFPVREGGAVRGTLTVVAPQRGFFHDQEVALLAEAAANVSFALDNFARDDARRQAEQVLLNEKQFSDTMIDSMPGVIYFYDGHGRFLRWNRSFEVVSGYGADEIRRMHPLQFFAGADRRRVEERIAEVFARGEASVEAEFVAKDGSATPYFFTGRRVPLEGQTCLVGVGIDLSDRRRAEARLAESERKYRELVEHANSVILRWNADGRITFLNEFGQRLFGYSAGEIVGRHVMGTIVPSTESGGRDLRRLIEEICARPEDFEHNVNENVRRNGDRVWIAWTNRIVRDAHGRVVEILSVGTDITERRSAEAEREKRHRAEAADRVKSAFLATMSHELRTPLNSIIGFTGIILQGLAGPLNAEQTKQLDMVRTSARHLLALVNDVLDISKIEAGQFEVACAPFDLRQSIDRVVALVQPQAAAKRLTLRVQLEPALGGAAGDQRRFEQILLNLLSNAVKFTDQGGIALTAERLADFQAAPPAAGGPAVRVRVADTGMGIKAADLPALFQPFRQVDSGLARRHEGTGLGLAICRRLAELMGGAIAAESEWGKGSAFIVTLPLRGPVQHEGGHPAH